MLGKVVGTLRDTKHLLIASNLVCRTIIASEVVAPNLFDSLIKVKIAVTYVAYS